MINVRLQSAISDEELAQKVGKIITANDYNVVLTGPTKVHRPDGSVLCVYLPGYLAANLVNNPHVEHVLRSLRSLVTDNRGNASGSQRVRHGEERRTRTKKVASTIIGSFDPGGPKQFCRQSAWNSKHLEKFATLLPFFQEIAKGFEEYAPARFERQMREVALTDPAWIIKGTPFTTVTVNNTYPTGVHTDSGDLEVGWSTLATLRRGTYTGGLLAFVKYRVAVDMQHGDLLLMDAHEHHGNTNLVKLDDNAERISVVSYFRTGMTKCGSADDEYRKAVGYAERRGGILDDD